MQNKIFNNLQIDSPSTEFTCQQDLTNKLCQQLNDQLTNYFVEGLKRKGFEFKDNGELETFIGGNCRCEDDIEKKERTYFVKDIPFFFHRYAIDMRTLMTLGGSFEMTANYGYYAFL